MASYIKRRKFLATLGGAAAWPLVARAQQSAMPVIGYLHSASPEPYSSMMAAFRHGLAEAGYVDGQNVTIDYRWAEGQFDHLPALAAELVAHRPAVLVPLEGMFRLSPPKPRRQPFRSYSRSARIRLNRVSWQVSTGRAAI